MIDLVAGARPNFMKLAPVHQALAASSVKTRIIHTGQHYDAGMSEVFFRELEIPRPDVYLEVGSGSHGRQTALIIERFEQHLLTSCPAAIVVFGDVNSTVACALAAVKLGVPIAHVEAGLRSFDRTMPEEINRILTDAISDLLLVSEPSGVENLRREGVDENKIRLVGNVMIDTLLRHLPAARDRRASETLGLTAGEYGFISMHRPSNVDDPAVLGDLMRFFRELSTKLPLVFPVHPRTRDAATQHGLTGLLEPVPGRFIPLGPQPYLSNLSLMAGARVVFTDSGGIQEETSVLGVPCVTMRTTTERPITTVLGTSRLVGNDIDAIAAAFDAAGTGRWPAGVSIDLWDGNAGRRVAAEIAARYCGDRDAGEPATHVRQ